MGLLDNASTIKYVVHVNQVLTFTPKVTNDSAVRPQIESVYAMLAKLCELYGINVVQTNIEVE